MNNPPHNDLFGQPLAVGDCVVFPSGNSMLVGTVAKLNPKMVKVKRVHTKYPWEQNKYPDALVKVNAIWTHLFKLPNPENKFSLPPDQPELLPVQNCKLLSGAM